MAKLDIPGKDYFKDPHVIASLAETVLFSCRLRIESDDVQLVDTVEAKIAKDGEKHKDRINDVNSRITLHLDGNEVPVLFHVELLGYTDTAVIIRVMDYDVNSMLLQARRIGTEMIRTGKVKDEKTCNYLTKLPHVLRLEPSITYVLNLTQDKWEGYPGNSDLYDPILKEYGISPATKAEVRVIDPHTMSDEQLDLLIPELKLLFLVVRYQKKEYEKDMLELLSSSKLAIGNQLATLLSSITDRFVEIPEEGGTVIVCESTRAIRERDRNEGIQIGRNEGRVEGILIGKEGGRFETALSFYRKGFVSSQQAAQECGMSVEEFLAKAKRN